MNTRRTVFSKVLMIAAGVAFLIQAAAPCTLAVIAGKAAANGRPLMWKNRDTSDPNNKLVFFQGPKYDFAAVVISEAADPGEVWGGQNAAGFAIMNSQADDLGDAAKKLDGAGNGAFMKLALGECATVKEFEALLVREKGKWDLATNFGVIDAEGGACFFETRRDSFVKFDAADPRVAPFGTIVRTNFAFTSPNPLLGGGFERFERIGRIVEAARPQGRIDARFILREAARDLVHEKLHSDPLARPLPDDPAAPLYVHANDTINRNTSVSVLVFEGAPSRARADLSTMWVLLGQPVAGVAVPVWPASGKVPSATTGPKTAPLNDAARAIVAYLYPDKRGRMVQYLNVTRLRTYGGEGVLPKLFRIEDRAMDRAAAKWAGWAAAKPSAAEMADFQESVAAEAYGSVRREFAGLVGQFGPAAVAARAARVESGLLPSFVIAGRPLPARTLAERMSEMKTPGVSVAVINDGAIEWARGYGLTETGTATPVTPRTLFQAASISKPVAALGALRLVEQGMLSLDEDVNAVLKSWKVPENEFTKTEKVTLRRLLSHTAGLTVSGFGGYPAEAPVPTVLQVLDGEKPANSAAVRVDVVPGKIRRYSGGGFTVAQQLMTDVTGRPFPDLMAELVLKPVGMADSTYDQPLPEARRAAAAGGHTSDGKPLRGRAHTYPEMAAAGLWTTPTDLARFLLEIAGARRGESTVLSKALALEMTTAQKPGYGLGLSLEGLGPAASFGHGGSNEGFKCQMTAYLEGGRGAVVMANGDRGGFLAAEILRAVAREYDWPSFKPAEKKVVPVDPAALAALEGRYELRPGRFLDVNLENGTLFVIDGEDKVELHPESETRFFDMDEGHVLVFAKGPDGRATHMTVDGQLKAPRR